MTQVVVRSRVAVSAAFMLQGLVFASIVTQVPRLSNRFGLVEADVTVILVMVAVLSGVGSVFAGIGSERRTSALMLKISLGVIATAALCIGLAPTLPALYAAFALYGIGLGGVDATMNMQGVRLQARAGRSLMAGFHGLWSVGGILGAGFAAVGNALAVPLAVLLAIVAVVVVGIVLLMGRDLVYVHADTAGPGAGVKPPWRPVLVFGLVILLFFSVDTGTQTWSSMYLDRILEAPSWVVPLGYAAYQVGALAARLSGDRLVMTHGAVRVVTTGVIVGVIGFVIVSLAPTAAVAIFGFLLAGTGLAVLAPLSFAALGGAVPPQALEAAIARMNIANYVGAIVGGGLIGVVTGLGNMRIAFAVPIVCAAAVLLLVRAFRTADVTDIP